MREFATRDGSHFKNFSSTTQTTFTRLTRQVFFPRRQLRPHTAHSGHPSTADSQCLRDVMLIVRNNTAHGKLGQYFWYEIATFWF